MPSSKNPQSTPDRRPSETNDVPREVHDFLSRQGQKGAQIGGRITSSLIAFAKLKLEEGGMSLKEFEEQVTNGTWTGDIKKGKAA